MALVKFDEKTEKRVNRLLLTGIGIKEVADKTNVPYHKVSGLRKKLVKANVLSPLYSTNKKKKSRRLFTIPTLPDQNTNNGPGFKLIVNGTPINIKKAKTVYVSPELVDIKY